MLGGVTQTKILSNRESSHETKIRPKRIRPLWYGSLFPQILWVVSWNFHPIIPYLKGGINSKVCHHIRQKLARNWYIWGANCWLPLRLPLGLPAKNSQHNWWQEGRLRYGWCKKSCTTCMQPCENRTFVISTDNGFLPWYVVALIFRCSGLGCLTVDQNLAAVETISHPIVHDILLGVAKTAQPPPHE